MKILWVSNSPIGPAAKILDEAYCGTSGGWIQSEHEALDKSNVDMSFICTSSNIKKGKVLHKAKRYFEKHDIDIGNRPVISKWIEFKLAVMDFISWHAPRFLFKPIKNGKDNWHEIL